MARKRHPGRPARWGLRIGLLLVAVIGGALLAPLELAVADFRLDLDGGARTALGASLVTGVLVGFVLIAHANLLVARGTHEAEERRTRLRDGLCAEGEQVVASLLGAHVMAITSALLDVAPVRTPRDPAGVTSVIPDARFTLRRLTRAALRVEAGPSWWRDPEAVDEVVHNYVAAVVLAEQVGIPVVPVWDEIHRSREHAAERLTRMAERLSAEGFVAEAQKLDRLAEALGSGWGLLDLEHRFSEPGALHGPWRSLIAEACWLGRRLNGAASRPAPEDHRAAEAAPIAT